MAGVSSESLRSVVTGLGKPLPCLGSQSTPHPRPYFDAWHSSAKHDGGRLLHRLGFLSGIVFTRAHESGYPT